MAELSVRRGTPDDARALSRLVCSLGKYFLADPERPEDADFFFTEMAPGPTRERLENPDYRCWVADTGQDIVAMIIIFQGRHLYQLFVEPEWHRQGLARRLWARARRDAEANGDTGPFTVNASLFAVPVYERFGFVSNGEVQHVHGLAYLPMVLSPGTD